MVGGFQLVVLMVEMVKCTKRNDSYEETRIGVLFSGSLGSDRDKHI
jgi:hypothetical protein